MKKLKKILKIALIIFIPLALIATLALFKRHYIFVNFFASEKPHFTKAEVEEGLAGNAEWFDDWYTVEKIAENTYAIGEPRYFQRNYNYLIIGNDEAALFDAGPGTRDIKPVVESITDLPYTVMFSHLHYDHLGNGHDFEKIAMIDLPHIRERTIDNVFTPDSHEHLGGVEHIEAPDIKITQWVTPDEIIDLGDRQLRVIYTPGHTSESYSLFDAEQKLLFSGDWFTEALGPMVANSSMQDFLVATEKTICELPKDVQILPAHKYISGTAAPIPLAYPDLIDTEAAFEAIKDGTLKPKGFFPAVYKVNDRVDIYSDITFFQSWDVHYPEYFESVCNH